MVDELLAANNFYYFPEPTYYRYPANTDNIFEAYLNNPDLFEEYPIHDDYLILRHYDLKKDLESITRQGQSEATRHKFYYYKGMIDKLFELIDQDEEMHQYQLAMEYNELKSKLSKASNELTKENLNVYYYFKGQSDILKQLILNAPIVTKT